MGFASRPQMHDQTETMKCVQEYVNQHASVRSLLELRFFPLPHDTQAKRSARYNLRKKDIRLRRA